MPDSFHPFSLTHALMVAFIGAGITALCWRGRSLPPASERSLRRAWVFSIYALQSLYVLYYLLPSRFDPAVSFPLHMCDLAGWLAAFALQSEIRWLRTTLFYWALGLCTQAFITPTVSQGPATLKFWFFWLSHAQIVGSALYDFAVRRYRPHWKDYLAASLVTVGYGAVIIPFDIIFHFNYGYLGPSTPASPTIIDRLGPWPFRLFYMWLIAQTVFFLLTLIVSARVFQPRSAPPPSESR